MHLHDHTNTHTGARPYKCKECDYAARDSGTLRKHKISAHSACGIRRKKRKEHRFFTELEKQCQIKFDLEKEREVNIDFKCIGSTGSNARIDG